MSIKKRTCVRCGGDFSSYNTNPKYCSLLCKAESQSHGLDPVIVSKMYWESNMSQNEVAESLGVTQKSVWSCMKRNNIPTRVAAKRDQRGANNHMWRGEKASYKALHLRIGNERGKPSGCEHCGTTEEGKSYDWANLSGDYANTNDYVRLCRSCHRKMDKAIENITKANEVSHMPERRGLTVCSLFSGI